MAFPQTTASVSTAHGRGEEDLPSPGTGVVPVYLPCTPSTANFHYRKHVRKKDSKAIVNLPGWQPWDRHFSCCAHALFRVAWTSFPARRPHLGTNSHPSVLQSFTSRLLAAEKCPESPRQDHNLQHRSLVHGSGAHKAHTILKLLPPISPSGMPHKKEFRPNWAFHPLPAFQGTAGQGQRSLPGLLDSVCAPSSPPLCNYDWNVPQGCNQTKSCPPARELKTTLQPLLCYPTLN